MTRASIAPDAEPKGPVRTESRVGGLCQVTGRIESVDLGNRTVTIRTTTGTAVGIFLDLDLMGFVAGQDVVVDGTLRQVRGDGEVTVLGHMMRIASDADDGGAG